MSEANCPVENAFDFGDEYFEDFVECTDVLPRWPLSVANGYSNGTLVLVVHISLRRVHEEEREFCAAFYRSSQEVDSGGSGGQPGEQWGSLEAKLPSGHMLEGYMEQPVLVGIVESIEEGEKRRKLMVRSVVWLQPFDPILCFRAESREGSIPVLFESFGSIGNRKLENSGIRWDEEAALLHGYRVDHVVERTPQVVDAVSGNQRPSVNRRWFVDIDNESVAAAIRVTLSGDGVGARITITPLNKFSLEIVEVFFSAANLQHSAGELRANHSFTVPS